MTGLGFLLIVLAVLAVFGGGVCLGWRLGRSEPPTHWEHY